MRNGNGREKEGVGRREMNVHATVYKEIKAELEAMTPEKRMDGAVRMLKAKDGKTQQSKQAFLFGVGFTSTEYLEALNQASNGELLRSVGV